ncbi:MAG: 3-dehydroquinate synthase [Bacteroidota bacterium]
MEKGKVLFGENAYMALNDYLNTNKSFSKVFVLTDSNTLEYCLPPFLQNVGSLTDYELIEIEPGEENKNIETVVSLWNTLTELGADRKSLLINLGGGVLTDMGGFVASTFKRGMKFINVPTTLLSMVDASTGGKTGIDLGKLKNQIGVFNLPEMVLVSSQFLSTLEPRQMRSGLAEMIKHGLIANKDHWQNLTKLDDLDINNLDELIKQSVSVKIDVVTQDPTEQGLRKILNYGHTIGHAVETFYMDSDNMLYHGEAIAIGMIAEAYLSTLKTGFEMDDAEKIKKVILEYFPKTRIDEKDFPAILDLMKHDKKNVSGVVSFSLLNEIGDCAFDCYALPEEIEDALEYYLA